MTKVNNSKRSNIGIVAWDTGDNSFGVTKPYLEYFSYYGNVSMILPQQTDVIEDLDLLVLPGGLDVDTKRYGQIPGFYTSKPNIYLEHFDEAVLNKYVAKGISIFGICRGLQTLNVFFGGTLTQHIYNHPRSDNRDDLVHVVNFDQNELNKSKYFSDINVSGFSKKFKTNSLHHQAINKAGDGILIVGKTANFGKLPEAFVHETMPIAAIQWHCEEIYDDFSYMIIKKLLEISKLNKQTANNTTLCIS
jgi:putative glutamine amidotransferase